ncbi:AraC family transcriptional regulator [Cellulophaga baltica]|uniref:helix-turn-helix domain-containing protein n=1 Tax=Cellulophaga TaxID=104264 RepID=UPI001C07EED6|nr:MULTISPECIES: AraC family transcriptional regulator [Cellulophaga]MBU2996900.1 AraC family transcriptional regulator [Cellulophaga baltica]MDO6768298.1 AraC family transcriptional regulator [Cellulophaga sp. 1_MG-2023]
MNNRRLFTFTVFIFTLLFAINKSYTTVNNSIKLIYNQEKTKQNLNKSILSENIQPSFSNTESASSEIFKEPDNNNLKTFIDWLFMLNALFGIFVANKILINHYKKDGKNIYFGIFLNGVSLMLLELSIYWWKGLNYNPIIPLFRAQYYFWLPTLYLYLSKKRNRNNPSSKITLHYLIPTLMLCFYIFINFYENEFLTGTLNNVSLKAIYTGLYLLLLIKLFTKNKSQLNTINKKWFITILTFTIILFVILTARSYFEYDELVNSLTIYFIAILYAVIISFIGFILFIQPNMLLIEDNELKNEVNTKYKNSSLTDDMLKALKTELEKSLSLDKIYLENGLTLEKLATKLDTDRYSLSQTINQEFGKNYYELINDYRINEAINIIENSKKEIVVADLIYESGFNNKVSFYKAFKKRHQKTPLEYQKALKKSFKHFA